MNLVRLTLKSIKPIDLIRFTFELIGEPQNASKDSSGPVREFLFCLL